METSTSSEAISVVVETNYELNGIIVVINLFTAYFRFNVYQPACNLQISFYEIAQLHYVINKLRYYFLMLRFSRIRLYFSPTPVSILCKQMLDKIGRFTFTEFDSLFKFRTFCVILLVPFNWPADIFQSFWVDTISNCWSVRVVRTAHSVWLYHCK